MTGSESGMSPEHAVSYPVDEQALQDLLGRMTLVEKIDLMSGQDFWSLPAIERLGIPSLKVSDGPTGLRSTNSDPATVFPVGVALAATWNPELVGEVGAAIGREAIGHGVDVLLAPTVNIQRTPLGGRNFETYSEDPHLSAEIGVAYVNGVQGEGVGTSLKHFVANNQEHERMRGSSNVSERALREIYLASFEAVVKRACPWTVMGAYNRINGVHACEHDALVNGVLKGEWGFDGVYLSDWGGTRSTLGAVLGGLDLEMPGPPQHFGNALLEVVENGTVAREVIDDHVLRILRLLARCGLLDGNPKAGRPASGMANHRELARRAAAQSIVLLKNEEQLLPLGNVGSVAIIGAPAQQPAFQGGGSSQVSPENITTPLEGLRRALPAGCKVTFYRGVDPERKPPIIDGSLLSLDADGVEQGLRATYFEAADFSGISHDGGLDWHLAKLGFGAVAQTGDGLTGDGLAFSAQWTGFLTPRYSGEHLLEISHSNPDVSLELDGRMLINADTQNHPELLFMILPLNRRRATVSLQAGVPVPINIRYAQPAQGAIRAFNIFNVHLREPSPDRSAAIDAAREADLAIIFAGSGTTSETEGEDRTEMGLGAAQNDLIAEVAAANSQTVVVVNTGAPIEMPWADNVPAIVQSWLPGQEGGNAVADVLTGAVQPSGKLPLTFPAKLEDNPTALHYPGGMQADYGEGIFVGYRFYDVAGIPPLFSFGHGLTYQPFEIEGLDVPGDGVIGDRVRVRVAVRNAGDGSAENVVQLYVCDQATKEAIPVRQLKAFKRLELGAGKVATIDFHLKERAFAWYDPDASDWVVTPGRYTIEVGFGSRDIRATAPLQLSRR